MRKRIVTLVLGMMLVILCCMDVYAAAVPRKKTPDYKVAFYESDCYHMQDVNGKRYGYGYDMMQYISNYTQGTFSYVGYEKTAKECEEMLQNGEIDLYTAARRTPEREKDYVFSSHPAITAVTCMNIKRGNNKIIAGDYSTYEGIQVGLYYTTPAELSEALIDGEVDALVNSYIRSPEDEVSIENFGETPYYFMARKENKKLIQSIDSAIDAMNVDMPKWRADLFGKYYENQNLNTELTKEENAGRSYHYSCSNESG